MKRYESNAAYFFEIIRLIESKILFGVVVIFHEIQIDRFGIWMLMVVSGKGVSGFRGIFCRLTFVCWFKWNQELFGYRCLPYFNSVWI